MWCGFLCLVFYVEIPVGGSLGKIQQNEVQQQLQYLVVQYPCLQGLWLDTGLCKVKSRLRLCEMLGRCQVSGHYFVDAKTQTFWSKLLSLQFTELVLGGKHTPNLSSSSSAWTSRLPWRLCMYSSASGCCWRSGLLRHKDQDLSTDCCDVWALGFWM